MRARANLLALCREEYVPLKKRREIEEQRLRHLLRVSRCTAAAQRCMVALHAAHPVVASIAGRTLLHQQSGNQPGWS